MGENVFRSAILYFFFFGKNQWSDITVPAIFEISIPKTPWGQSFMIVSRSAQLHQFFWNIHPTSIREWDKVLKWNTSQEITIFFWKIAETHKTCFDIVSIFKHLHSIIMNFFLVYPTEHLTMVYCWKCNGDWTNINENRSVLVTKK